MVVQGTQKTIRDVKIQIKQTEILKIPKFDRHLGPSSIISINQSIVKWYTIIEKVQIRIYVLHENHQQDKLSTVDWSHWQIIQMPMVFIQISPESGPNMYIYMIIYIYIYCQMVIELTVLALPVKNMLCHSVATYWTTASPVHDFAMKRYGDRLYFC